MLEVDRVSIEAWRHHSISTFPLFRIVRSGNASQVNFLSCCIEFHAMIIAFLSLILFGCFSLNSGSIIP